MRPRLDGGVPAVNGFTPDARRAVDGWAGACAVTWRSGGRKRGAFWLRRHRTTAIPHPHLFQETHKYTFGEEDRFRLKGRCRRCWGGLIGKKNASEGVPTAIRCRVCGSLLKGDEAREEYRRMSKQDASNTFQMAFGFPPKYRDDARFVSKISSNSPAASAKV